MKMYLPSTKFGDFPFSLVFLFLLQDCSIDFLQPATYSESESEIGWVKHSGEGCKVRLVPCLVKTAKSV